MSRKRNEEQKGGSSLAFLDIIACAFGAIVLLVLILPIGSFGIALNEMDPALSARYGRLLIERRALEDTIEQLVGEEDELLEQIARARALTQGPASGMTDEIRAAQQELRDLRERVADTQAELTAAEEKARTERPVNTEFGGIPVDSEYVAFVIDCSGSMQWVWRSVLSQFERVLALYPRLKGFQVLSDQGQYMYADRKSVWISDSAAARRRVLNDLSDWKGFSQSNPAPGIRTAVSDLFRANQKMAIFVFGDDFAHDGDLDRYVQQIDNLVRRGRARNAELRIHTIGFSNDPERVFSEYNFAVVMRALAERHGGAFVALPR